MLRTALTVRTSDAGGIEPLTSRPVSVRLPDGPVNALSELRTVEFGGSEALEMGPGFFARCGPLAGGDGDGSASHLEDAELNDFNAHECGRGNRSISAPRTTRHRMARMWEPDNRISSRAQSRCRSSGSLSPGSARGAHCFASGDGRSHPTSGA
jgi:hypothetical protein